MEDKDWHNLQSARMDYVRELAREKNTPKEGKYSIGGWAEPCACGVSTCVTPRIYRRAQLMLFRCSTKD